MALRSLLSAFWILLVVALKGIEWVIEVYWFIDWQLLQSLGPYVTPLMAPKIWLRFSVLNAFLAAAMVSDSWHSRERHWSHWLVLISTLVSSVISHFLYLLA